MQTINLLKNVNTFEFAFTLPMLNSMQNFLKIKLKIKQVFIFTVNARLMYPWYMSTLNERLRY